MISLKYMVASLLLLMQAGESLAAEAIEKVVDADITSLTLVVGNTRKAGGVKPSLAELVGQSQADFTHEKRRVVSVDVAPLEPPLEYKHLALDFVGRPFGEILARLDHVQPMCIFFEWFPSCITRSKQHTLTPLLLPALENAYKLLSPGGELVIDHMPYVSCLPDIYADAMKGLEKVDASSTLIAQVKATVDLHKMSTKPGIVSRLLQKADPFTLHINRGEHDEIRSCLIFHYKNNDTPFDDSKCQFIKGKGKIIYEICAHFSSIFDEPEFNMVALINNGFVSSYKRANDKTEAYWDLFEQHYYTLTRAPLIKEALLKIGFTLGATPIQYHPLNPYNHRKHAMIITAKKPGISSSQEGTIRSLTS